MSGKEGQGLNGLIGWARWRAGYLQRPHSVDLGRLWFTPARESDVANEEAAGPIWADFLFGVTGTASTSVGQTIDLAGGELISSTATTAAGQTIGAVFDEVFASTSSTAQGSQTAALAGGEAIGGTATSGEAETDVLAGSEIEASTASTGQGETLDGIGFAPSVGTATTGEVQTLRASQVQELTLDTSLYTWDGGTGNRVTLDASIIPPPSGTVATGQGETLDASDTIVVSRAYGGVSPTPVFTHYRRPILELPKKVTGEAESGQAASSSAIGLMMRIQITGVAHSASAAELHCSGKVNDNARRARLLLAAMQLTRLAA